MLNEMSLESFDSNTEFRAKKDDKCQKDDIRTYDSSDDDLVFPSLRLKGKKPPVANMLVADHLRVAARKAGVVAPPRAFGFHTFRRTLASVLVKMKVDVKTVQELLRHQNLCTTLELYAKSMSEDRLKAQGMFLQLLFSQKREEKLATGLLQ